MLATNAAMEINDARRSFSFIDETIAIESKAVIAMQNINCIGSISGVLLE